MEDYGTARRPAAGHSNARWQVDFAMMKNDILLGKNRSQPYRLVDDRENDGFSYSDWLNDILENIRTGEMDYCFYIFQVWDLLNLMEESEIPDFAASWNPIGGYFSLSIKETNKNNTGESSK